MWLSLSGAVVINSANMKSAINGFKKKQVFFPVDTNVFTDADFLPSAPTDINLNPIVQEEIVATSNYNIHLNSNSNQQTLPVQGAVCMATICLPSQQNLPVQEVASTAEISSIIKTLIIDVYKELSSLHFSSFSLCKNNKFAIVCFSNSYFFFNFFPQLISLKVFFLYLKCKL